MNRIKDAFSKGGALASFLVGGDPSIEKSAEFIDALVDGGSDLIQIGIPFSDPIAESPVIQEGNLRALAEGCTIDDIFDLVKLVRSKHNLPIVLLTYLNPVFKYGYDKFFSTCGELGVDGVFVPDIPFEGHAEISEYAAQNGVDIITLIATDDVERIKTLAKAASGFIYVLPTMDISATRADVEGGLELVINTVRSVTTTPVAVGYDGAPADLLKPILLADGILTGSHIVEIIRQFGSDARPRLTGFVQDLKKALGKK